MYRDISVIYNHIYIYICLSIDRSIYTDEKKTEKSPTIPSWIGSMGVAARIFGNVVGLILNCNDLGFFNAYWSTQGTEQNSYTHKSSNIDHFDSETHDFREGSNDPLRGPLRNRCPKKIVVS